MLVWLVLLTAPAARADVQATGPVEVPFGDTAVQVGAAGTALSVAVAGLSDGVGPVAGQTLRARAAAERRGRARLAGHVDAVLERCGASAATAERVHAVVEAGIVVRGTRHLIDGSVVLLMELPLEGLERVWPEGKGKW